MSLDFNKKVQMPDHVMKRDSDGEAVILNVNTEQYHGLDEVASDFLEALIENDSIAGAVESIQSDYEVSSEQLHADLTSFITELLDLSLIHI